MQIFNTGNLKLAMKGMAMGIAEVIPGVSGGTIAFVTGIYEQLIDAIKSVDIAFFKLLLKFQIAKAWQHIDGPFLGVLLAGMIVGLGAGIFGVSHLMDNYPEELWGFFFGLILASALYIAQRVKSWETKKVVMLMAGAIIAYGITLISPTEGSSSLLYVFICGAIAISALILPGISGSFMLLLMGMYTVIIPTVKHFITTLDPNDILIISVFALGCITGLMTFSRVLSWLFHNFHDMVLACLTGIMLGSLNKIWPWRNPVEWLDEHGNIVREAPINLEEAKVVFDKNVMPSQYTLDDPNTIVVIICAIVGFAMVFVLDKTLSTEESN